MRIQLDSEYSNEGSLKALQEFAYNPYSNELKIKFTRLNSYDTTFHYASQKSRVDIDFHGEIECNPSNEDKVGQIVRLFEKIEKAGDLEFLKRYFAIKLK
jgi:hypothetical protein